MEKLMQFKNKVIYKGNNYCMEDEKGTVLPPKSRVQLMKMWRAGDCSVAYLEKREKDAMFVAQEMHFQNEDGTFSNFSICSEGCGNIPCCYVLATYELSSFASNRLRKARAWISEEMQSALASYRCKSALYVREFDKKGRCLWLSVIANEEGKGKSGFSAVDLQMKYSGDNSIPSKISVVPADKKFLCQKRPECCGKFSPIIPEATKEVLKNFNISVPKNILDRQKITQNTDR